MTVNNVPQLRGCKSCEGTFLSWSTFDLFCGSCEESRTLDAFRNDYYRNAAKIDRFQPNYHTLENADQYAKAQMYYKKHGDI